ncbi:hypothetical protein GO988_15470 [Hymenobacter sp. HMF4947]|uniref:Glycine-rich domain-containing protein n=1 Tax=Hymenobacter ginkgonis TaxID=2682976 RepID=A0A7K1THC1_9BACT|nr:hypothetical protein [Hymenobacter ginkgonis]MVN77732.1 hypothetical protein [Hymenobacter ginkgonis]
MALSPQDIGTTLPGGYVNSLGGPADAYYAHRDGTPYATAAEACAAVPVPARKSRTVNVAGLEYQWLSDTSDAGLKLKVAAPGVGGNVIALSGAGVAQVYESLGAYAAVGSASTLILNKETPAAGLSVSASILRGNATSVAGTPQSPVVVNCGYCYDGAFTNAKFGAVVAFNTRFNQSELTRGIYSACVLSGDFKISGDITLGAGTQVPDNFLAAGTKNANGTYTMPAGGIVTDARGVGGAAPAAAGGTTTVQVFTASATWTKPAGAKLVRVIAIGGGAGGGSGCMDGNGSETGGGGGGGGARSERTIDAALLPATVEIAVGAGGVGGAGPTNSNVAAPGSFGAEGGISQFGTFLRAFGGNPGVGALKQVYSAQTMPARGTAPGGTGGGGGANQSNAYDGAPQQVDEFGAGSAAGGGGGAATDGTGQGGNGGSGGVSSGGMLLGQTTPALGGQAHASANGTSAADLPARAGLGANGGGGGAVGNASWDYTAGIGGKGGFPGGGGGGGAGGIMGQPGPAGNGGKGGDGLVLVYTYF